MARRLVITLVVLLLASIALLAAVSWRVAIAPADPPPPASFDPALVARGANLAALGNCVSCHTAADGKPYAGGYPMHTPFGTIYGTNITPDPETGIGRWSLEAFVRAMREGVDREGRHLYPAFPYTHFNLMSDDDLGALYAYMMTREPVRAERPQNDVPFPLDIRMLLAGWKLLFLEQKAPRTIAAASAGENRGAYLVQGVAHCGACHTPRNVLGAEKKDEYLFGGEAEGWHAPALDARSPAPVPWTADALYRYLRYGASETHAAAAGPMAPVVTNLAVASEQDVRAISAYIASVMGAPDEARQRRADRALARARGASGAESPPEGDAQAGALLHDSTCAVCHNRAERPPGSPSGEALHLALSTALALDEPGNLMRIVLQGRAPPDGERGPHMPGFHAALTDEQIASLVNYLRAAYTDRPAWRAAARDVRRARTSIAEITEP